MDDWTKSLATEIATGEHELETEEEMIERVLREETEAEDDANCYQE